MNFLQYIENENTLNLKLRPNFEVNELLSFLSKHKEITNINLNHSMLSFDEDNNNSNTYLKILTFFKSINEKKLCHLESIDLSNNNLGKIYFNPPSDDSEYNLIMKWTWIPVTSFLNTWRYYFKPTENPAYEIKRPCSLIEYFGNSISNSGMHNLTKLSLSHTEMTDYDLEGLCNAFNQGAADNLEIFDLSTNRITSVGIDYLVSTINNYHLSQLIEINLNSNRIDTEGAKVFFKSLQKIPNSKLEAIRVECNYIEDEASLFIVEAIYRLPHIKQLSLVDNKFSIAAFDIISKRLSFIDNLDFNISYYTPQVPSESVIPPNRTKIERPRRESLDIKTITIEVHYNPNELEDSVIDERNIAPLMADCESGEHDLE